MRVEVTDIITGEKKEFTSMTKAFNHMSEVMGKKIVQQSRQYFIKTKAPYLNRWMVNVEKNGKTSHSKEGRWKISEEKFAPRLLHFTTYCPFYDEERYEVMRKMIGKKDTFWYNKSETKLDERILKRIGKTREYYERLLKRQRQGSAIHFIVWTKETEMEKKIEETRELRKKIEEIMFQ